MKKSEITAATNATLIILLANMMSSSQVFKKHLTSAKWICEELANRNVVHAPVSLFSRWRKIYAEY